jgi:nitrogen fixation NifU-like protein
MMTQILQGKTRDELTEMAGHFIAVMRGEEPEDLADWGEIEALRGVIQLPARVKCATLAWHALEPEKNT